MEESTGEGKQRHTLKSRGGTGLFSVYCRESLQVFQQPACPALQNLPCSGEAHLGIVNIIVKRFACGVGKRQAVPALLVPYWLKHS